MSGMGKRFERCRQVVDGVIVKVYRVAVRTEQGQIIERDYIRYPGAAVILPVLGDGSIVLIRNWRFTADDRLIELPAGHLDAGEDPAVCAARELAEETGYTATRLEKLGAFYTSPGSSDEIMHAFLATELTAGRQQLEAFERITVEVLPDETVRGMVADGTIRDGKTIAALGLYWLGEGAG